MIEIMERILANVIFPFQNPNKLLPGFELHLELLIKLEEIKEMPHYKMQILQFQIQNIKIHILDSRNKMGPWKLMRFCEQFWSGKKFPVIFRDFSL